MVIKNVLQSKITWFWELLTVILIAFLLNSCDIINLIPLPEPSAPGTPTNFKAVGFTTVDNSIDFITFTWTAPKPGKTTNGTNATLTGYKLEYSNTNNIWTSITNINSTTIISLTAALTGQSIEVTVKNLSSDTSYSFRLSASNSAGLTGAPTGTLSISTAAATYAPETPIFFAAKTINSSSIEFTWKTPVDKGKTATGENAVLTGYKLEYSNASNIWTSITNIDSSTVISLSAALTGESTRVTVLNLSPITSYSFRLSASNSAGFTGTPTDTLSISTAAATNEPGTPTGFIATKNSTNSITFTWSAPSDKGKTTTGENATLTGYKLEYKDSFIVESIYSTDRIWKELNNSAGSVKLTSTLTGESTGVTVTNLSPGTPYFFRLSAINSASLTGKPTAELEASTASAATPPDPPGAITVTKTNSHSLILEWTPPNTTGLNANLSPATLSYLIQYSNSEGWHYIDVGGNGIRLQNEPVSISGGKIAATVRGLTPSTSYYFRVIASNTGGMTTSGNTVFFTTSSKDLVELSSSSVIAIAGIPVTEEDSPFIILEKGKTATYSIAPTNPNKTLGAVTINTNGKVSIFTTNLGKADYTITVTIPGTGETTLSLTVRSKYVITASDLSLPTDVEILSNANFIINGGTANIDSLVKDNRAYLPLNKDGEFTHTNAIKTYAAKRTAEKSYLNSPEPIINENGYITVGKPYVVGDIAYIIILHENQIMDDSSINYKVTVKNYHNPLIVVGENDESANYNGFSVITATGENGGSVFKTRELNSQTTAADITSSGFNLENGKYISLAFISVYSSVIKFTGIEITPL